MTYGLESNVVPVKADEAFNDLLYQAKYKPSSHLQSSVDEILSFRNSKNKKVDVVKGLLRLSFDQKNSFPDADQGPIVNALKKIKTTEALDAIRYIENGFNNTM